MGGAFSSNKGGGGSVAGGSGALDDTMSQKEPASITPVGRGPNGELIYNTHDQNIMAGASVSGGGVSTVGGGSGADPVLHNDSRRKWQNRFLAAGVATLCIILVVLIVIIFLVLSGGDDEDDPNDSTATGSTGGDNSNDDLSRGIDTGDGNGDGSTSTPTLAPSVVAALSLLPSTLLPTLSPTTLMPSTSPTTDPTTSFAPSSSPSGKPPCTVCYGNATFANPNARIFPFLTNNFLTCQSLADSLDALIADADDPDETCLQWQVLGSMQCGCGFPHPQAYCTLCPDGILPLPEVLALDTPLQDDTNPDVNLKCFDLVFSAASISRNREPTCSIITPSWASFCQCPGYVINANTSAPSSPPSLAPTPSSASALTPTVSPAPTRCTLCADGQLVASEYLNEFAVDTVAGRNLTCAQFEVEISTFTDDCFVLQIYGSYNCGCVQPHPQAVCNLCPDGQLPPEDFRHRILDDVVGTSGRSLTCFDLYLQAARSENSTAQCQIFQIEYGTRCGCFGGSMAPAGTPAPVVLAPTSPPCSLCGDGLPVPEEFLDEYAVTSTTSGRNFTCRELEIELATFRDDCFVLQLIGSYRCGCIQPHPRAVCDLCWDGSLPPDEFLNAQIDELGSLGVPLTCEDLYLEAARIHNTSQACLIHQSRYGTQCGCPPITRPSPTVSPSLGEVAPTVSPTSTPTMAPIGPCTLCADGSLVQAEYHSSFAISTTAGRNLTCLQLEIEISTFIDACLDLQLFGTYNCGCPAPPFLPNTCPVCPNNDRGLPPPEFRDVTLDELGSLGVPLRCRDLYISSFLNTNRTDLDCRVYRSRYAPQCGCDLVANNGGDDDDGGDDGSPSLPPATASLPPPSSEPLSSSTESPTAPPIPEPTSSSSPSSASPLPVSASPPSVTSSPTVQANCTLCADGRIPENPNNAFLPTNPITCLEASFLAPFLASGTETTTPEEACLALQALGALECGCGYPHPQWECLLCDTLPDKETRDVILVSTPEEDGSVTNVTCGGAIVALSSIQNETECEEFASLVGPACGCV